MLRNAKCNLAAPRFCCLLLLALLVGCGSGGPEVAPVKGHVTLDGRPLDTVDIVFQPTDGTPPATSRTDKDGYYEMIYKRGVMGARVGEHTVRIGYTSNIIANPPKIPARYNTNSELRREVASGQNEFDFELKSEK